MATEIKLLDKLIDEVWPFKEADLLAGMNAENSHADLLAPLLESEITKLKE